MKYMKYPVIGLLCLIVAWVFANLVYPGPDVGEVSLAVAAILFFLIGCGTVKKSPEERAKHPDFFDDSQPPYNGK
jgi:hypothetical protein